ncbi:MAG: type II toxin-antitoxin system PemK/MazF family toxin [Phycisphaerales bacterium]|nr:type II toxin-antitoxin system PemK/MazF family toxin [Phycisphaerales bacterium]
MVISQGDVWWTDFGDPIGSAPGYRRPAIVVQSDILNRSNIATVICVPLTSNLKWERMLGNVFLSAKTTGLPKDSVANVSQITTLNKSSLIEYVGKIPTKNLQLVLAGIDVILGR